MDNINSKQRILYLDSLKGFAIILMVIGHAISWSFDDYKNLFALDNPSDSFKRATVIYDFIYSFHMPLFFMISGYLLSFKQGYINIIKKRFFRLMVPYIFTGFLIYLLRGYFGYWFLFSLWEVSMLAILFDILRKTVNKNNFFLIDILLSIFVWVVFKVIFSFQFLNNPIADIKTGVQYPFMMSYLLGYIIKLHDGLKIVEKYKESIFLIFLVTLLIHYCNFNSQAMEFLQDRVIGYITPIFGALTFVNIFKSGVPAKLGRAFSALGKKTLEIYVFHVFFVIQLTEIGSFWLNTNIETVFATQVVYTSIISSIAIACSLIISSFINRSKVLSFMFLGKKI